MVPIDEKIDKQQLRNFLIKNDIANTELAEQIGVSRRSIVDWLNKDVEISENSWTKIKEFMRNFEKNRIEEEEME